MHRQMLSQWKRKGSKRAAKETQQIRYKVKIKQKAAKNAIIACRSYVIGQYTSNNITVSRYV